MNRRKKKQKQKNLNKKVMLYIPSDLALYFLRNKVIRELLSFNYYYTIFNELRSSIKRYKYLKS